jgi:hypothetical protein
MIQRIVNDRLVFGLGISYHHIRIEELEPFTGENTVLHLIIGIHSYKELERIQQHWPKAKVLFLRYKVKRQ